MFPTPTVEVANEKALDAARAEGRLESAVELARLVTVWQDEFVRIVARELNEAAFGLVLRFAASLQRMLEFRVEQYRRDHQKTIDRYVQHCRRHMS